MNEDVSDSKSFYIPIISIMRYIIQIVSFLLVNYIALELIFSMDGEFSYLEEVFKVLPFIATPKNAWTAGAGLLEYTLFMIGAGEIPYFFLAVFGLLGLFSGRIFCGWMCPTGFLQDLFAGLAGENRHLSVEADRSMKKFKFFLLIVMLALFIPLGYYRVEDAAKYFDYSQALGDMVENPLKMVSFSEFLFVTFPDSIQAIIDDLNFNSIFDKEEPMVGVLFVVYLIIIAISIYYPRFYCKYMCVYGAAISVFSEYSFLKLQRLPTRCPGRKECGACERVCDMQVRILDEPFSGFTGEGECTLCLKCLEACSKEGYNAIKWKFGA